MPQELVISDEPRPGVRRLTLNRPDKRNALSNPLRADLYARLEEADLDDDIHVTILRGAGSCFSSGYDLAGNLMKGQPWHTASGDGNWSRHVVEGHFRVWDMRKPVIAQVHGYCLAGGSELAASCDLVYIAEDAQVGYPPVRLMSPPDMQFHPWMVGMRDAMELMLTGDAISGIEAAEMGFA
ncbi:MAG: enoyl-CoA hydratase/isomerase family protein, partial [Myxococcota bacterium]